MLRLNTTDVIEINNISTKSNIDSTALPGSRI